MHTRRGMNEISVDKREGGPNSAGRGRVFGMQESGWRNAVLSNDWQGSNLTCQY